MKRVAILGAGISGLATAHYLRRGLAASGRQAEILLFEADREPGGTMRTSREQGFLMETGPNGFLTNKPDTLELVRELGCAARLLRSSDRARRRFVYSGGRLNLLPESPGLFLTSQLLTPAGRLRVLAEPFIPARRGGSDESVAQFARRRLGDQALEKLIEPMTAGVFAGDPDRLSLASCFPRIQELERRYGGLVKAMVRLRWARRGDGSASMSAGPGGVLTSFDTGTQALVEVLAGRFSGELRLGAVVESVLARGGRFLVAVRAGAELAEHEADAVVIATPSHCASLMISRLDQALAQELARIPYAPVAVVALGYEASDAGPLEGFGFLVPRREGRRILGALWDSSVFAGRAPQGKALIRVMLGGARQPELAGLPEPELLHLARQELRQTMGLCAEPVLARVFRHERGIPQYLTGHGELLGRVAQRLSAWPGLHLNSNAYRGVSLNDCVRESRLTAQRVLEGLA